MQMGFIQKKIKPKCHREFPSWTRLHSKGESGVVTCSALKKQYRDILIHGRPDSQSETNNTSNVTGHLTSDVKFLLLHGDKAVLRRRMEGRQGHFMPASLLDSQLHVLEIPVVTENCLVVDVDHTVENIVSEIISLTWQKGK
ncbi:hypothetical protein FSP39_000974 [Pinctada imbricata]|uniref:gluconokinase n=1 Tax=Pinctada imbricata TaxID=66713 RepID=A0AA88Y8A5_PINIB|nr:hypothetical protein FSP39_000974 [Pinctada imbricata]